MLSVLFMQRPDAFWMFNGRSHDHIAAICSWHSAAHQNNFLRFPHLHYLEILHGHTPIAHMTWHTLVLPNASRRGAIADRTDAPVHFRTVRRSLSGKIVFLHHALESFAFRATNYIHEIARLKLRNAQIHLAFGKIILQTKFAHKPLRFGSGFFEFTN